MSGVIDVTALRKHFGRVRALDGLDLQVTEGEAHGFLGPNGAGKSTTIRILLGLVRASGGTARLFGRDPWRDAVSLHRDIAYVPGDVTLWPSPTGGETIDLLARMRGGIDRTRRDELIERFDLDPTPSSFHPLRMGHRVKPRATLVRFGLQRQQPRHRLGTPGDQHPAGRLEPPLHRRPLLSQVPDGNRLHRKTKNRRPQRRFHSEWPIFAVHPDRCSDTIHSG